MNKHATNRRGYKTYALSIEHYGLIVSLEVSGEALSINQAVDHNATHGENRERIGCWNCCG